MRLWPAFTLLSFLGIWGGVNQKNKEGAELYLEGRLDEALEAFTEAQVESPDAPELHYNIGNVHYRKGEVEKALDEYRAATKAAPEPARRAQYGTGNVRYRRQEYQPAVEAYKAALKIDPEDIEARQNLELALRKLEEQKKDPPPQQPEQEDQGGGDGGSEEKQSDPQQESQQEQDRGNQGAAPQDQTEQSRPESSESAPTMSKEDAERILAALAEMEKAEQQKQQQKKKVRVRAGGKDW